ncbi:tetracycline resistance ribosomal protection protein, partial [Staphylococcus aureus]|nr:tetracycline resistance ribosomal protection protein [Staphylococcus aureus]
VKIKDKGDFELTNVRDDTVIQSQIIEKLLDINDYLAEKYINGDVITEKEYDNVFLDEVNSCNLYPVLHGSALKDIGID